MFIWEMCVGVPGVVFVWSLSRGFHSFLISLFSQKGGCCLGQGGAAVVTQGNGTVLPYCWPGPGEWAGGACGSGCLWWWELEVTGNPPPGRGGADM